MTCTRRRPALAARGSRRSRRRPGAASSCSRSGRPRVSVRDATYFGISFIRSANGSPARPGQAPAITCHVRRPKSSASVPCITSSIAGPIVSGSRRHRPAAVGEAPVGVLFAAAGRLHDTVEAHEVTEDDPHRCSFRQASPSGRGSASDTRGARRSSSPASCSRLSGADARPRTPCRAGSLRG